MALLLEPRILGWLIFLQCFYYCSSVSNIFFLFILKIFLLSLGFQLTFDLIWIWLGCTFEWWFYVYSALYWDSWTCGFIVFIKFRKFPVTLSSNIYSVSFFLSCSSPSWTSITHFRPLDVITQITKFCPYFSSLFFPLCFSLDRLYCYMFNLLLISSNEFFILDIIVFISRNSTWFFLYLPLLSIFAYIWSKKKIVFFYHLCVLVSPSLSFLDPFLLIDFPSDYESHFPASWHI